MNRIGFNSTYGTTSIRQLLQRNFAAGHTMSQYLSHLWKAATRFQRLPVVLMMIIAISIVMHETLRTSSGHVSDAVQHA